MKFDSGEVELYLPCIAPGVETKRSSKEEMSKPPMQALIKSVDLVDPLRESYEHLPEVEGCPKHVQQESAAIQ